jgi:hypothetical protein
VRRTAPGAGPGHGVCRGARVRVVARRRRGIRRGRRGGRRWQGAARAAQSWARAARSGARGGRAAPPPPSRARATAAAAGAPPAAPATAARTTTAGRRSPQVGFIGLGRMGARMVPRLLDAGYEVVVEDKNKLAVERVQEIGREHPKGT